MQSFIEFCPLALVSSGSFTASEGFAFTIHELNKNCLYRHGALLYGAHPPSGAKDAADIPTGALDNCRHPRV